MKAEWTNKDSLSCEETTKAILVIDKMPKNCDECHLRNYDQCYGLEFDRTLIEKWDGEDTFKARNKICPLRPLPEIKYIRLNDVHDDLMFQMGWNACIEEITGETE